MTDDNVTIVRTKLPEARHTSIQVKPLERIHVVVRFSQDSERYLRRMGYSQKFCDALHMLLTTMTNNVINTAENEEALREQRKGLAPHMDYSRPEQPIRTKMPTDLTAAWMFFGLGEERPPLLMPNLWTYFPNTTQYPEIYNAFVSAEGQRFMNRYYVTGWLRQDAKTGEWIVAPPVRPHDVTPRRSAER